MAQCDASNRYWRRDNVVCLESINPDGRSYEIHLKEEPGRLVWMWPVIRADIDLRRRRRERVRNGGMG